MASLGMGRVTEGEPGAAWGILAAQSIAQLYPAIFRRFPSNPVILCERDSCPR